MAEDDSSLQVGARVAGRYDVRARLGAGGMGVVYEVVDRQSEEAIALKTLRRGTLDPQLIKREFRALADVVHPNLVQLYDLFDAAGVLCLTMELVPGVDLMTELRGPSAGSATATLEAGVATRPLHATDGSTLPQPMTAPPRDVERVLDRFAQLARALAALHRRHVVHRDIKPHNVRVTPEGRVVVLDFGLATAVGAAGTLAGTIAYMAPEQADGVTVLPAADWYSFGIMLHEVLTGRVPWSGPPHEVLRRKRDEDPPTVRDVPADLAGLVGELLARDPAARPDAEHVLERLGRRRERRTHRDDLPEPMLIGRRAELAQLGAAWARVAEQPVWLAIEGGSGIGKTTLVQAFERVVGDAAVLRGRCYEREAVAYKGIDEIVEQLVARLVALGATCPEAADLVQAFPVTRVLAGDAALDVGARIGHERRGAALRGLLERLARDAPVLVVLDDVQWADRDCLAVLGRAFAPPGIRNAMLVVCARVDPEARWNELPLPFVRIRLGALSPGEAIDLAQTLLGRAALTIDASGIASRSGGQPFDLIERVRAALSAAPGAAASAGELLVRRVAELAPEVRAVVELAVVAGAPIAVAAVGNLIGAELARAALERAQLAGLVRMRRTGGRTTVEPAHDHVREVVFAALAPALRAMRAASLATALEATGHEPAHIAELYVIAGQPDAGRRCAEHAAERMSRLGGHDAAAGLWRQVAALCTGGERRAALARCGEALALAGRGSESAELFLALARQADDETERLHAVRRAAEELFRAGRIDEGMDLASRNVPDWREPRSSLVALAFGLLSHVETRTGRVLQRNATATPAQIEVLELRWAALNGSTLASPGHFLLAAERYLRAAIAAGDPERISLGWSAQATLAVFMGSSRFADRCLERGAAVLGNLAAPRARAVALATAALIRLDAGAWARCVALVADALDVADRHAVNLVWERNTAEISTSIAGFMRGDLAPLVRHVWRERERVAARGDLYAYELVHSGFTVIADLLADEPERATRTLGELTARPTGVLTAWLRHIGHALVGAYGHNTAWHRRRCDELLAGALALPLIRSAMVRGTLLWSRAALELAAGGDRRAAARWIGLLRRVPARGMRGLADLLAGHAALRAGDATEARARGAAAELALLADDMPTFAAAARWLVEPTTWPAWRDALAAVGAVRPDAIATLFAPALGPTR